MIFIKDNLIMMILFTFLLFGVGLIWPLLPSIVVGSVSKEHRATASSFYNAIRLSFQALGPIIVGFVAGSNLQNLDLAFIIVGIVLSIGFVVNFILFSKVEKISK